MNALVAALEASALGSAMRGSGWAYQVVNLLHLLGLVLLIGPMLLLDLRLLGAARRYRAADVSATLTPWMVVGLVVLITSGGLLFAADAVPLASHRVLQFKLALIAVGIGNALLFRRWWSAHLPDWDARAPAAARAQAALSVAVWLTAAALGRLIAYR